MIHGPSCTASRCENGMELSDTRKECAGSPYAAIHAKELHFLRGAS